MTADRYDQAREEQSSIEFHFKVVVRLDVSPGVELNALQTTMQERLQRPTFDDIVGELTTPDGRVSNKSVTAQPLGMTPGRRKANAGVRAEAEEAPVQPMASTIPESHQPSVVPQ